MKEKFEFFCIGNGGSGGPYISGWIIFLFPYLDAGSKNHYVFGGNWKDASSKKSFFSRLTTSSFKYHMNQIPFTWNYLGTEIKMLFVGGLVGVVSEKDNSLMPIFGYSIMEDKKEQNKNNEIEEDLICSIMEDTNNELEEDLICF